MPISQHFGPLIDLNEINLNQTAILVIDETGDPYSAKADTGLLSMTQHTAALCRVARENNIPVIFANDAHLPGIDHELAIWGDHCLKGTMESTVSDMLEFQKGDYLIEKRRYSAFYQTGLRSLLDELGITALIACGFDTNICILHTLADAFYENYRIVIAQDATTSFLIGDQEEGINYMRKCYGALPLNTADIIDFIKTNKA